MSSTRAALAVALWLGVTAYLAGLLLFEAPAPLAALLPASPWSSAWFGIADSLLGRILASLALPLLGAALRLSAALSSSRLFVPALAAAAWVSGWLFGIIDLSLLAVLAVAATARPRDPALIAQDPPADDEDTRQSGFARIRQWHVRRNDRRTARPSTQQVIIDELDDGLISIDLEGTILHANKSAERLLGVACRGMRITRFMPSLRADEFKDLATVGRVRMEGEIRQESTATLPVEFTLSGSGSGSEWVGVLRLSDISERAAQMAKLERLALHDSLTGLPNRVLLHDRINQALSVAERRGEPMAVMLMDLNKFKQVNDTLGHHVGDLLLQAVGPRLSGPLRKTDTLARLGGDEFAVLLPPPTPVATAREVAERLVEAIAEPFDIEGMKLDLGIAIGVALYPEHGGDLEMLMHNADMVMYKAKRGQLGYCVFDSDDNYGTAKRVQLQQELRKAIDNGELEVVFQPKVSSSTWEASGFEALVRWPHPTHGYLSPSEFLPLAEQTGLIMPLTLNVINECLSAQRQWREAGLDLSVAVNVSPKWLQDPEFPRIIRLLLQNWHGRADRLILEIPESAIMNDPVKTTQIMRGLNDQGIDVSLDDFGTGYSSLPLLQRLPIQELKIDQRFIGEMVRDQNAAIVVRAVVKLAHALSLRVVAEGVESRTTAEWLAGLGGDELQGYFFGKPMRTGDVPRWTSESFSQSAAAVLDSHEHHGAGSKQPFHMPAALER